MQQDNTANNKRIAKNTVVLYIRMIFLMVINLYTSRLVLQALGVDDFGIYNVVGGFVTMFSLLSGALSNAISRFLTFELGRRDIERLKDVFSTSVTIQILLASGIVLIAEAIGIWFLNARMNIPAERMVAANWVFQCSLLTFAVNLISIPYNACIIAHEKMTAFAYISILEVVLKLCIVVLLLFLASDRLIIYGVLLMVLAILIRLVYGVYCSRHFEECHYGFTYNRKLVKEMIGLASWNFLGSSGAVLNSHGVNILMNLFFGVSVNAARGIAVQVNGAVSQFVSSFTTAVNPQITKSYAERNIDHTFKLVFAASKYSYFLMLILVAPIVSETPYILELWLSQVPDYSVLFVRLTLVVTLLSTLSTSLYTLALATGDIKNYQIVVGGLSLSCFFVTYICYKLGLPVEYAYYIAILINVLILFARIKILSGLTGLNVKNFIFEVIVRVAFVSFVVFFLLYLYNIHYSHQTIYKVLIRVIIITIVNAVSIWLFGLKTPEKQYIRSMVVNKIKK